MSRSLKLKEENEAGEMQGNLGFMFDPVPVKSEYAQISSVMAEYGAPVSNGMVEFDKYYPAFIDKLEKAGVDTVIKEMQRQLDEWFAKK